MKYLFGLIYLAAIITPIYFWNQVSGQSLSSGSFDLIIYSMATLAGLVGFTMMLLQLPMGAKFRWLEKPFGQDTLMRYHRWTGIIGVILVVFVHVPLLELFAYRIGGIEQLKKFVLEGPPEQKLGATAATLLIIVFVVSLYSRKLRIPYHWFKRIHFLTYIAVVGGFIHSLKLGTDLNATPALRTYWYVIGAVAGVSAAYRWVYRPMRARMNPYAVVKVQEEAAGTRSITLRTDKKRFDYAPGQFMYVKFKNKGVTGEWHPFTISSSPTEDNLMVTPKELGDWTNTLGSLSEGDVAYVEGPFGRFTYQDLPSDRTQLVMIAGGIGITPMRSMLKHLADTNNTTYTAELLYGNRTEQDIAFKAELDAIGSQPNITVHHVLSKQDNWSGPTGRIDKAMIEKLVNDITTKDYFVCGPPPMMKAVISTLKELGVPSNQIHSEQFSFK